MAGSTIESWVNTSGAFLSTDFDDNPVYNSGFLFIPPDSHLAAGPLHIVTVVNTTISFHQKDGTLDYRDSLSDFFSILNPETFTFDPKVVYDQNSERWLVLTLEQTEVAAGDAADSSRIFLGVSDDENPNGTWYVAEFNSRLNIGGNWDWADYPGFAVGEDAVYITANMFPFVSGSTGTRLWIVDKGDGSGGFYDGGTVVFSLHDPYAANDGIATTTQPAHMYGDVPGATGTYLVSYSGLHNNPGTEFIQVVRVDDPLGTPTFTQTFLSVGDLENTNQGLDDAPQFGSGTDIEVNDRRALDAVWIDDALWMTATIRGANGTPDAGQATAYWWAVDTTVPDSLLLIDQATIGGEDIGTSTSTFFPSVAINGYGDAALGFSASNNSIYPGAYFVTREAGDPAGTTGASQTVAAGTDFYVRTFGGPRNRWGDYSATAVDPVDGCFWVYNQYAMSRGTPLSGEDGRWATAVLRSCNLTHPCSDSFNIPSNTWTRFALPCNVTPNNSVEDIFSGLDPADYGTGWRVYRRESSVTPHYELLTPSNTMVVGEGYWVISSNATTVNVNGTINPLNDFDLFSDPAGLQNYVGHNQADTVSWADVRFVSGGDLLTLDEAETAGSVSRQMYKWNGAAYQVFNGIDPQTGTLDSFDGFWVKAFDPGLKIRIPQASAVSVKAPAFAVRQPPQFETSFLEVSPGKGDGKGAKEVPQSWHVRLTAASGDLVDPGNHFGRKADSSDHEDMHDLIEPEPFGNRYLTVLFTNSKLTGADWGYTSDFRKARNNPKGDWPFVVRASSDVHSVTLSWDGDDFLFEDAWLTDEGTGEVLKVHAGGSYTFDIEGGERHFMFEID